MIGVSLFKLHQIVTEESLKEAKEVFKFIIHFTHSDHVFNNPYAVNKHHLAIIARGSQVR